MRRHVFVFALAGQESVAVEVETYVRVESDERIGLETWKSSYSNVQSNYYHFFIISVAWLLVHCVML